MKNCLHILFIAVSISVLGCSGEAPAPSTQTAPKPPTTPTQAAEPKVETPAAPAPSGASASISGRILFSGTAPEPEELDASADPVCDSGEPLESEELVVGEGSGLANVFLYIKSGITDTYAAPAEPVVLDQVGCKYIPHVFGVQVGQPIEIINSDGTLHNVHSLPTNSKQFNVGMPLKGMKIKKRFDAPETMVRIKCDVHPWMSSYAGVVAHPFFSVSGTDGSFQIDGVPAGKYTLGAWHEKLGEQELEIDLTTGEDVSVSLSFSPAA